jgi:hypothetical protein
MFSKTEGEIIETYSPKSVWLGDVGEMLVKYKDGKTFVNWSFYTKDNGKQTLLFTSRRSSSYTASGVRAIKKISER